MKKRCRHRSRGQSTIEYVMMVGFGALFAIQIMGFFTGIFKEGMQLLEANVQTEMASGQGFGGPGQ